MSGWLVPVYGAATYLLGVYIGARVWARERGET